jgi:hypothetical protein
MPVWEGLAQSPTVARVLVTAEQQNSAYILAQEARSTPSSFSILPLCVTNTVSVPAH